jgi:hypothetical protein
VHGFRVKVLFQALHIDYHSVNVKSIPKHNKTFRAIIAIFKLGLEYLLTLRTSHETHHHGLYWSSFMVETVEIYYRNDPVKYNLI